MIQEMDEKVKLKITVIPTEDEFNEIDSTLINDAQHNLLDLWEEAEWNVDRRPR